MGTSSGDKNELLFSQFGINYNQVALLAKGSVYHYSTTYETFFFI